jgi:hypothetical protein
MAGVDPKRTPMRIHNLVKKGTLTEFLLTTSRNL